MRQEVLQQRKGFKGRFEHHLVNSSALSGNPLGDPTERSLWVYLPPEYDESSERYPTIYVIQGFLNEVDTWWNRSAFKPNVPERVDQLFSSADVPPAILLFVDGWTSVGGSQFVNSPATGWYLDYLAEDVVGFVDERFRTTAGRDQRAISGHSSGGFGAMYASMKRPDVFGAFATHSGDSLFELCYLPEIAIASRAIRDRYGSYDRFWEDFRSRPPFSRGDDAALLNIYAMSACYSPRDDGTPDLPFEPETGLLRDDVWRRWLEFDPVRMAPLHFETLRSMRAIWIDAGKSDEYNLDLGATAFSSELTRAGIAHFFELFDGRHGGVDFRYPLAWRYLAERLSSASSSSSQYRHPTSTQRANSTGVIETESNGSEQVKEHKKLLITADGASRGNPGLAGIGVIIADDSGHRLESLHDFLGVMTNNQAEYRALIAALEAARRYQPDLVTVRMDSQLVVKQMRGEYKVKHPEILPLFTRAVELASDFPGIDFEQVPRERNAGADKLANMAIDSRMVRGRGAVED